MVVYQGTWLLEQQCLIVRQQSTVKNGDSTECRSPPSICAALFYLHYISVYYILDCLGGLFKKVLQILHQTNLGEPPNPNKDVKGHGYALTSEIVKLKKQVESICV